MSLLNWDAPLLGLPLNQYVDFVNSLKGSRDYEGWGFVTGLEPTIEPRSFGPKCKCCGNRNMKRIGPLEYGCLKTGQIFSLKELLWP